MSENRNLVQQVTSLLRRDIMSGRLEPGVRLTEAHLATDYGVSRVPVREALRILEGEGFVVSAGPRTRVVAAMTAEDAADLFAVRATVEAQSAGRAALRATPAQLRVIRSILGDGQDALARGDLEPLSRLNTDLHRAIAEASGSPMLLGMFNQISHKVSWLYSDVVTRRAHSSWREHADIVDALIAHDAERARELMRAHIDTSRALREAGGEGCADHS